VFVNTVLATGQGTGAVSWLQYAFRIMYLPIGLFGVSIATAAMPVLATLAVREDLDGMRQTVSSGLRMMLMLNVPATIGLVVLAEPIVSLLYERGSFTSADTPATAAALMFYAPGLLGYSAVKIASPSFYALRDTRTPVATSIMSVLLNVVLNLALVRVLGYRGLALGTALAALANAGVLLWLLRRRLGGIDGGRVLLAAVKIALASLAMAMAAHWGHAAIAARLPAGFAGRALALALAIGLAMAVLALAARVLRLEEFDQAMGRLMARARRA